MIAIGAAVDKAVNPPTPPPTLEQDREFVANLPALFHPDQLRAGLEQIAILCYVRPLGDWKIGVDSMRLAALLEEIGVDRVRSYNIVGLASTRYLGQLRTWLFRWEGELGSRAALAEQLAEEGRCLIFGPKREVSV